eukprot:447485_1
MSSKHSLLIEALRQCQMSQCFTVLYKLHITTHQDILQFGKSPMIFVELYNTNSTESKIKKSDVEILINTIKQMENQRIEQQRSQNMQQQSQMDVKTDTCAHNDQTQLIPHNMNENNIINNNINNKISGRKRKLTEYRSNQGFIFAIDENINLEQNGHTVSGCVIDRKWNEWTKEYKIKTIGYNEDSIWVAEDRISPCEEQPKRKQRKLQS